MLQGLLNYRDLLFLNVAQEAIKLRFAFLADTRVILNCIDRSQRTHVLLDKFKVVCVQLEPFNKFLMFCETPFTVLGVELCRCWGRRIAFLATSIFESHYLFVALDWFIRLDFNAFSSRFLYLMPEKVLREGGMEHPDRICHISNCELIFLQCLLR